MAGWIGRRGAWRFRLVGGARLAALAVTGLIAANTAACASAPVASAQTAAQAACTRASALVAQGYLTAAEGLLKANLGAADPCVQRELRRVFAAQRANTPTPYFKSRIRAIRGLVAAGFSAEAAKQIQALVEANPNRPIPPDLRALNQRLAWWQLFLDDVGPPIRTALEIVIGFLALIVIVLLAAQLTGGLYRRRWPATYTIGTVTGIDADADKHTELLKAELVGLSDASYGHGPVRRAASAEQAIAIPAEVTNAVPQTQLLEGLIALLDRLLPRRLTRVNVAVLPADPIRGVGLTVQVATRSGRVRQEQTVWANDYFPRERPGADGADDVCRLMLPAAVWLAYQPALQTKRRRRFKRKNRLNAQEPRATNIWASFAHFAVAERAQGSGDLAEARRGYLKALDDDPANSFALLNLAGLKLYREPDGDQETPQSRLAFAKWLLCAAGRPDQIVPDGFVALRWLYLASSWALYAQDAQQAQNQQDPQNPQSPNLALVFPEALYKRLDSNFEPTTQEASLTLPALYRLLDPQWPENAPQGPRVDNRPVHEQEALERLKSSMRAPAWILLQSARMQAGQAPNVEQGIEREWWSPNVLYNLACFYARRATNGQDPEGDLALARTRLCQAIDRAGEPALVRAMAASDPILADVQATMAPPPAEHDYSTDARIGRGWGVRMHEAVKSTVFGEQNGRNAAPALPEGTGGQAH